MMKNYDQSIKINHNPNWPYIPDHPYRILILDGSGFFSNIPGGKQKHSILDV